MEKSPVDRKPNRVYRGRVVRAVLAEVFDWRRKPSFQDIGYEPVGIGGATEIPGQLTIQEPEHWNNWSPPTA